MTKEYARIFFKYEPEDDLDELWEARFFEQKQYFLTHVPIRSIWEAKIKRLKTQYQSYLVLTDRTDIISVHADSLVGESFQFSDDFIVAFNELHALRTRYKAEILKTQDVEKLTLTIEKWLADEHVYAKHWAYPKCEEDEVKVLRSKELDPMELLQALKETEKQLHSSTIRSLWKNYDILQEEVKKEVKRLSLLAKN